MKITIFNVIIFTALLMFPLKAQEKPANPHILVKQSDRVAILDKIKTQEWARTIHDEIYNNVTPYVRRHEKNPEWILSRYLMNRVPGKRYTRAISDRQGYRLIGWSGDAPVPTVRVSSHVRGPVTPTGGSYRKPDIDQLVPYDTARMMNLLNTESGRMERIDPQAMIGNINGDINDLALEAALIYWLTGEAAYAKFAADIINQWARGAYYQEPITGPCRTGFLDMQTLGDAAYRSLILAYDFVKPFMKEKKYELKYYETVFEKFASTLAFRGYYNNNWYAAESSTLVFASLSLEDQKKRDYYLSFFLERDTMSGGCGQLGLPSTVRQWLTPDGHWKEPGGYHNYPVSNLLLSSLALENNGYDIFRKFPALFRASYAMLKYSFPNLTVSAFGDTGRASQGGESLEIGILAAVKYGQPELPEMLASLKKLTEGGRYRRENSGYAGLLCFIPEIPVTESVYSWPRSGELEFAKFYLQRNGTDPKYGLMYGVQGASYNHNHNNGMAMELYGMGEVMGIDAGTGPNYEHPYHVNYYSQWAAHNTVAAAGASSSVPFSGSAGRKDIGQIELAAMEPMPDKTGVSKLCSFTDTRYFEKSTGTNQMRTMALVRTSVTSGYYVDIFRSDNKISNDYIYHNIGDTVIFTDERRNPLRPVPAEYPLTGKDYPGFRYYTGVHKVEGMAASLIALFRAKNDKQEDIFMQVLIPGAKERSYFLGKSMRTRTAGRQYNGKKLPLFTMRDEGESVSKPFTGIFEPYEGAGGYTIESVSTGITAFPEKSSVITVKNRNGDSQVIFQSVDPGIITGAGNGNLRGYFGVAGLKGKALQYLYLGKGSEISWNGYAINVRAAIGEANLSLEGEKFIIDCNQAAEVILPLKGVKQATLSDSRGTRKLKVLQNVEGISVVVPAVRNAELRFSTEADPGVLKEWEDVVTAGDLWEAAPERVEAIFRALDNENPALKKIFTAWNRGRAVKACELLLDYYSKGKSASWLRKEIPASSSDNDSNADSILLNIYTFYNQPFRVPRDVNGHLDWTCKGPTDDIEWAWALNRHYHIGTLLNSYFRTGNRKYSLTIDRDIKDWILSSLPYPAVRSSTEMWRGLEVSFRVKAWSNVFFGLMKSGDLTPATRLLILSSLPDHAHYARNFHAQGNWLTMELSGLATVATSWPEYSGSASWLKYAGEAMTESLKEQVYPDGAQTELTSSYHLVALNNFSLFMDICNQAGEPVPEVFRNQIEKMWNYTAYTNKPDGYGLLNNDADLLLNRDRITRAAEKFGRPDWLYIASNGQQGTRPEGEPSVIFPWAGHFIMRSGFEKDAHFGFFDIGPWGSGHQHNDKLHLSISAFGKDFLVDGGRFSYRGDVATRFRRYATGSHSHNLVLPDGKVQAAGPVVTGKPVDPESYHITKEYDYASGSFDRYSELEGKFTHNRSVLYVRDKFWIVLDHLVTDRPRKIEVLWHWHPDCTVTMENDVIDAENNGDRLKLIPAGPVELDCSIIKGRMEPWPQGWYSEEYNIAVPSPATVYAGEISGNSAIAWIIYPGESSPGSVSARIINENADGVELEIEIRGEGKWVLTVPFSENRFVSKIFSSSGTFIP